MAKTGKTTLFITIGVILVALVAFVALRSGQDEAGNKQLNNNNQAENNVSEPDNQADDGNEDDEQVNEPAAENGIATSFVPGETLLYLGDASAADEMLFVFDYSCPWCSVWLEDFLPLIQPALDQGTVKFRAQSLALLNEMSLILADIDQNLKVHYPEQYYDVFTELIAASTTQEITDDYLAELAAAHELDLALLQAEPDLDAEALAQIYLEHLPIDSVPTVFFNGEKLAEPFDHEAIEALIAID